MIDSIADRLTGLAREDQVLILLGLVVIAGAAMTPYLGGFLDGGTGTNADAELVNYCENVAAAAETNSSLAQQGASCECLPPGTFNPQRYSVDPDLDNATQLFLVKCSVDGYDQPFVYPIRRIANETMANRSDVNTTVPGT